MARISIGLSSRAFAFQAIEAATERATKARILGVLILAEPSAPGRSYEVFVMQQQVSVITLGVTDLARSKRFYGFGFGWTPVFENEEIVFYQMNGFVLGTFISAALEKDMARQGLRRPGAFALAHNVAAKADVEPLIDRLAKAGGSVIRPPDAPPHGGFRGYVADPDDHAWEIAWNPAWPIDDEGRVTFGL